MNYKLKVEPMGVEVNCDEDETLLDALLREEIKVKNVCRSGRCGMCKCLVTSGEVDHGDAGSDTLTEPEREEGYALLCTATPLTDVEIEVEESVF